MDVATSLSQAIATDIKVLSDTIANAMDIMEKSNSANVEVTTTSTKSENNASKNSSLEEDMLGANTLLMSDSEDEENNEKKPLMKSNQTLLEMPNERNEEVEQTFTDNLKVKVTEKHENSPPTLVSRKKKKFSAILDSDSDENEMITAPMLVSKTKSKFSALIDSDSESDDNGRLQEVVEAPKKNSRLKLIDTDSDSDDVHQKSNKIEKQKKEKKLAKKQHTVKAGIIDSDTASEVESAQSDNGEENDTIDQKQLASFGHDEQEMGEQSKPMRASAKKAIDEMQAIQSEQQRLHREAHISVPYHRPKRYTLQEFLKRRTIMKPTTEKNVDSSPITAIVQKKSLKMTPEELEEYAKLMEERAKEAKEFFKSESESEEEKEEEEEVLNDNSGCMDVVENIENKNSNEETNNIPTVSMPESVQLDALTTSSLEDEKMNLNDEQIEPLAPLISTQPLITEVVELPNLDLNTLHVNEKDDNTPVSIHKTAPAIITELESLNDVIELKRQLFTDDILMDSPTIKGDANMIIDLDSGDMIEKQPSGTDNLLQRLLSTHKARKSKTNETVSILLTDNGRLEMTKINIHVNDDDKMNKEQKPGAAYVKLKESLKTLIKKKRVEEMHRKQEDEKEYNRCLEIDNNFDEDEDEDEYDLEDGEKVGRKKHNLNEIIIDDEENAVDCAIDEMNEDLEEAEDLDDDEDLENVEEQDAAFAVDEAEEVDGDDGDVTAEDVEDITNEKNQKENKDEELDLDIDQSKSSEDTDKDNSDTDDNDYENQKMVENIEFKAPLPSTQRKNRIIKGFAADSDDDDMDLLKTQAPIVQTNVANALFTTLDSPMKSCMSIPYTDDNNMNINNTQELLSLCSGTFDVTQKPTISTADTVLMSQIPMTQQSPFIEATEELLGLCSGSFDGNSEVCKDANIGQTQEKNIQTRVLRILSSDEDEEEDLTVENGTAARKRVKKLRKKLKKRQMRLGFSDDEDENEKEKEKKVERSQSDEDEDKDVAELDDSDKDEVEIPDTYVDYDSEENEIIVEMTQGERIERAANFFEKEAELSESDWGSADEDEKHMDNYDIELGDDDEFDRGKLQQELGQIHARKMLDEDIREVRKIQQLLFEDEENDGVGRQRQFRWKHAENGFSLDDMRAGANGEDGFDDESGDEEQKQEHLWRKIRFEREQLLKEKGLIGDSQEGMNASIGLNLPLNTIAANISNNSSKNTTPIIGNNGKRIQIITKKTVSNMTTKQKGSPFLISSTKTLTTGTIAAITPTTTTTPTTMTSILQPKAARGSFLARDKETLTKFANFTKNKVTTGFDDDETAGTVSVKGKHFVFTTLTKEEHENIKRKADDLINSSTETGINFMKKPRTNIDKQCLIDQLLM